MPAAWVKRWKIEKGLEVDVEEDGRDLVVRLPDRSPATKVMSVRIGKNERLGKTRITSAYRQGFDELTVFYEDPSFNEVMQKLLSDELMGFEIVEQEEGSCLIRDLTGDKRELTSAIDRLWELTCTVGELASNPNGDEADEHYEKIAAVDKNVNKFSNHCLRLLTKHEQPNKSKAFALFVLATQLEQLADIYKDLWKPDYRTEAAKPKTIGLLKKLEVGLDHVRGLYNHFEEDKVEEAHEFFQGFRVREIRRSGSRGVASIHMMLWDILSTIVEISVQEYTHTDSEAKDSEGQSA